MGKFNRKINLKDNQLLKNQVRNLKIRFSKLDKENQSLKQQLSDVNKIIDEYFNKKRELNELTFKKWKKTNKKNEILTPEKLRDYTSEIIEIFNEELKSQIQTLQENSKVHLCGENPNSVEDITAEPLDAEKKRRYDMETSAPKDNDICECGCLRAEHDKFRNQCQGENWDNELGMYIPCKCKSFVAKNERSEE